MDTEETFFLALKTHRESKSIEIDEISDYTKINPKYLNAIEEGNFDVIPNIYMRLFIRSYAKYIDVDYKQALVDYELYTTGEIQPKFFDPEKDKSIFEKKATISEGNRIENDFQINYKQVIIVVITAIAIYSGFKLLEFISDNNSNENIEKITPSTLNDLNDEQLVSPNNALDYSLLTNQDFENSKIAYQITKIMPFDLDDVNLTIETLNKTKINIVTNHKDGSVFF